MINTGHVNAQQIQQQSQKDKSYFELFKIAAPYVIAGIFFESLSKESILRSPETVAWAASKTFEVVKWATLTVGATHCLGLYSPLSQAPKSILLEKEIKALRTENARFRQKLAARQAVAHTQ